MHDIKWLREHADEFDQGLARRGLPAQARQLLAIDETRRAAIQKAEAALARRNAVAREIGAAKRSNEEATAQSLLGEVGALKEQIPALESEASKASRDLDEAIAQIPNLPLADVPDGKDSSDNIEHHHFGAPRTYGFAPKQHFELGEALGQMDFETAAKLSGARFVLLRSGLARLERALGQFMLDLHTGTHGYQEIAPPLLVRDEVMYGTAQLPKFRDDQFVVTNTETLQQAFGRALEEAATETSPRISIEQRVTQALNRLWLIPTAEVPLTNVVRDAILEMNSLPMRLTALTPCFRAEAGAAGKDTRGMIRQHQFNKVELVSITAPEQSKDEHERMLSCAEEVLRRLDLHYRVVTLCTGDMGFPSQKTYDIEVWLPGQKAYREISSCSQCGDFQARRMNARFRDSANRRELRFVHTLNGSGVAVGRALIAIMETYQQQDGCIAIPQALEPYMAGLKAIDRVK
ncbi:MAG: serine--tRNA ligase [Xanthobacteraceae bacterium]